MENLAPIPHDSPVRSGRGRVMVPAAILAIYSILISRFPLLNYLGYEYSAAVALIFPLVPGLYILEALRMKRKAVGTARIQAFLCLALPLAIGYINSFAVKNCAPGEGLQWYLLLPGVGMIWVIAIAYFFAAAFEQYIRWYLLAVALVLIHPVLLGYFTPRVDSYNFVYGYFPGFTYDEDLRIETVLVHWRAVTLLCAVGLFIGGALLRAKRGGSARTHGEETGPADSGALEASGAREAPGALEDSAALEHPVALEQRTVSGHSSLISRLGIALLVIVIGTLCAAWFYRTDLGFETTTASLRHTLGSFAETRHFRIYYDSTAIPSDEIKWVAAEHEFRFAQVSTFLGTDTGRVIESYIYPNTDAKRRLTGAGNTDIAKPWRDEIHLDGDSWRMTLKHELVHALAGEFGMPVIRANVNIGLTEGLAMAASPTFGNRTLREYAASMIHFGIVDDPAALIRPAGFAFQSSTVSYILMGAFCEHIIGRYGMERFKTWYRGGSPEGAYGKDADSLVAEWMISLESVQVPAEWSAHTDYFFRRGSIFARECARVIANLNADGGRSLGKKEYVEAQLTFGEALEKSWNATSFTGLIRALLGSRAYVRVIDLFETERLDSAKAGSLAAVKLLYGDALLVVSDYSGARTVYEEIRKLDLSPGTNEAVALRLIVANDPTLSEYLSPVIAGTMDDSVALEWLDGISGISGVDNPALLGYLKGRLLLSKKDYVSAARVTADYFAPFPSPVLNGALNDVTAAAFFRLEDFLSARVFYERTLEYIPGAALSQRVRDRQERCRWFEREWEGLTMKTGRVE